jgi:hypothetical protein
MHEESGTDLADNEDHRFFEEIEGVILEEEKDDESNGKVELGQRAAKVHQIIGQRPIDKMVARRQRNIRRLRRLKR